MKEFFKSLPRNFARVFAGKNIFWHLLAMALTAIIVISDFDWKYFLATESIGSSPIVWPAVILGFFLPVLAPITIILFGLLRKDFKTKVAGWMLGQAAFLGYLVSIFYKSLTGRMPPPFHFSGESAGFLIDNSRDWNFGFLQHGIFWGWPSSHTTVAFAMAFSIIYFYPKNKTLCILAFLYALYVGLSVSTNIHWFSEFVAGAIIGAVAGATVGKHFRQITG